MFFFFFNHSNHQSLCMLDPIVNAVDLTDAIHFFI